MQRTVSECCGEIEVSGVHVFDLLVKWPIDDYSKWPLLWVSSSRSEKENDSSLESADPVKLFRSHKDTASFWYWNGMRPFNT